MSFTTQSTAAATTTAATAPAARTPGSLPINQDQFLGMLMTELKNQNPMSPNSGDPMQFITELAQFTAVEQETNTAETTKTLASGQNNATAIGLIGHGVSYVDPSSGAPATGTVQSVTFTSNGPTLTINGTSGISASAVTQVS